MKANRIKLLYLITIVISLLIPGIGYSEITYDVLNPIKNGLEAPEDVAVSSDGKIYVVDGYQNKVFIYDRKGWVAGSIPIQKPTSVAINNNGAIYISTNDDLSVKIFNSSHTITGSLGKGAGEFQLPRNVTVDKATGNVYVVDQLDYSIKVYTSDGAYISRIDDYPNIIQDVTLINNEIYVLDQPLITNQSGQKLRGAQVSVFDMKGLLHRTFGFYGTGPGQMIRPRGITSDSGGILYITDSFLNAVICFDKDGSFLGTIQTPADPMLTTMGIALGQDRRLFAASLNTSSVYVSGLEGYISMEVSPSALSYEAQQGGSKPSPQSITISNSGTGTLTYEATSTESWIAINGPIVPVGPKGSEILPVGVNISGLSAGTYSGEITITDNSGISEVVTVTLEITEPLIVSFTVTPSAGANGSINPSPPQTVNYNATTSFMVTPNTGYQIESVTGCSGTMSGNTYATGPITGNCTVKATFAINPYTITASAGANGSINPLGAVSVNYGANQSFSITPSANCGVADVQVDGSSVGAVAGYTFNNVMAVHTIVAIFNKLDITPPTGSITINSGATYTNTTSVTLNLSAYDPSGVSQMCISNTRSSCLTWVSYTSSKSWTLPPGDGTKTVYVWYQDKLGNANTAPYSASITLDTTAPLLTVSTLPDGSWTNNELLNVAGEVTDDTGIQQLTINGAVVTVNPDGSFSYPINLQEGPNAITVIATDLAGNQSTDTRTINVDQNAPIITITSPADNVKTKQSLIDVRGAVDDQSTVTVKVNDANPVLAHVNGNDFSLQVTPVYGMNTIEVTATDLARNTSTAKRTVTFDDRNPSLSVTDPPQDVKTNQADMIIKGEAGDDLTPAAVTIMMDNDIYATEVTSGKFEQPVTFTEEKTYQIYVKAVDEAGNETVVQRNVVYDTTAPAVTLNPVTSPTNLNSQVLTGTMEEGVTVSVTCSTATVGAVTYPASTVWSVTLTNMAEGNNQIIVTASDAAGNVSNSSNSVTAAIVVATKYTITASAGSNGSISPSGNVAVNFGGRQTFTITPNTRYRVVNVLVDGSSVGAVTTYTFSNVTANHTISASFSNTYNLTVTKAGTGSGTVRSSPARINCGSSCSAAYNNGSSVTLTASKNTDSFFAGWSGGGCSGTGTCKVKMNADKAVIATFTQYIITVTLPNGGESWARGTTQAIKWTYADKPGSYVKIELLKAGVLNRTITTRTSIGINGTGSYKWTVPRSQATGSDYTIRITSRSNSNYKDTSNGNFTIK